MQDPATPAKQTPAGNQESFIDKAIKGLNELTSLQVNTLVGDYRFLRGDDKKTDYIRFDPESTDQRMSSVINLISGDISTAMTDKFVSDYKDLRDYHLTREAQGHDIIRKNIEVLKEIAQAISGQLKKGDS